MNRTAVYISSVHITALYVAAESASKHKQERNALEERKLNEF